MIKNTLTNLKKVCTFAFLPRIWRGHIVKCTPKKFQRLPLQLSIAEKSTKSSDTDQDNVEKCKRIIDYAFGHGEFPSKDVNFYPVFDEVNSLPILDNKQGQQSEQIKTPDASASTAPATNEVGSLILQSQTQAGAKSERDATKIDPPILRDATQLKESKETGAPQSQSVVANTPPVLASMDASFPRDTGEIPPTVVPSESGATAELAPKVQDTTDIGALSVQAITDVNTPSIDSAEKSKHASKVKFIFEDIKAETTKKAGAATVQATTENIVDNNPQAEPLLQSEPSVVRATTTKIKEEELKQKVESIKEPSVVEAADTIEDKVPLTIPKPLSEKAEYNDLFKKQSDTENSSVFQASGNGAFLDESTAERLMHTILCRSSESQRRRRRLIKTKMDSRTAGSSETEGKMATDKRLLRDIEKFGVAQSVVKPEKTPIVDMDPGNINTKESTLYSTDKPQSGSTDKIAAELVDQSPAVKRKEPKIKKDKPGENPEDEELIGTKLDQQPQTPTRPGSKFSTIDQQISMCMGKGSNRKIKPDMTMKPDNVIPMPKIKATVISLPKIGTSIKGGFIMTDDISSDKPGATEEEKRITFEEPYFPYDPRSPLVADEDPFTQLSGPERANFRGASRVVRPDIFEEVDKESDLNIQYEHIIRATETITFSSEDMGRNISPCVTLASGPVESESVQLKPLRKIRNISQSQWPETTDQGNANINNTTQWKQVNISWDNTNIQSNNFNPNTQSNNWDPNTQSNWNPSTESLNKITEWDTSNISQWSNQQSWGQFPNWYHSSKEWEETHGWSRPHQQEQNSGRSGKQTVKDHTKDIKQETKDSPKINVPPTMHTTSTPITNYKSLVSETENPNINLQDVYTIKTSGITPRKSVKTIPEAIEKMHDEQVKAVYSAEKSALLQSTAERIASVMFKDQDKADSSAFVTKSTPSKLSKSDSVASRMKKLRTAYITPSGNESHRVRRTAYDVSTIDILKSSKEAVKDEIEVTLKPLSKEQTNIQPDAESEDTQSEYKTETTKTSEITDEEQEFSMPISQKVQYNIPAAIGPMPVFMSEKEMPLSLLLKTVRLRHRLESYKAFLESVQATEAVQMKESVASLQATDSLEMKKKDKGCPPLPCGAPPKKIPKKDPCAPKKKDPCAPKKKKKKDPCAPKKKKNPCAPKKKKDPCAPKKKKNPCAVPKKKKDPCAPKKKKDPCAPKKKKDPCAPKKKKNPCSKYVDTPIDCPFNFQHLIPKLCFLQSLPQDVFEKHDEEVYKEARECPNDLLNSVRVTERTENMVIARGFEPWTPIPSWPVPQKPRKRLLVCPKEGCVTPGPLTDHQPCKPKEKDCKGFPKFPFSALNLSNLWSWNL